MRVVVSSNGSDLNAPVSPVFGRCPAYVIVDSDTLEFEALANPAMSAPGGAGIQAAQMVANQGAQAVITGNVGPNAFNVLASAGIQIYLAQGGTVREVVEAFKAGQLQCLSGPSAGMHAGMGMGAAPGMATGRGMGRGMGTGGGMGRGMGMGGGMGRGMGMGGGMGRGMGRGMGSYGAGAPPTPPPSAPPASSQAGVEDLRAQMQELREQLAQVLDRIDKLDKK